jgi:hypothetical protein
VKGSRDTALFIDEAEAARLLGLSVNGLRLARQRGEVDGFYVTIGRRVMFCGPALRLRALGIASPAEIGALARGAGIHDLAGLLAFLGGDGGSKP